MDINKLPSGDQTASSRRPRTSHARPGPRPRPGPLARLRAPAGGGWLRGCGIQARGPLEAPKPGPCPPGHPALPQATPAQGPVASWGGRDPVTSPSEPWQRDHAGRLGTDSPRRRRGWSPGFPPGGPWPEHVAPPVTPFTEPSGREGLAPTADLSNHLPEDARVARAPVRGSGPHPCKAGWGDPGARGCCSSSDLSRAIQPHARPPKGHGGGHSPGHRRPHWCTRLILELRWALASGNTSERRPRWTRGWVALGGLARTGPLSAAGAKARPGRRGAARPPR